MHLNRIAERTWQTRITSKLWYNLFNTNKTDQKLFSPSITLLVSLLKYFNYLGQRSNR